MEENALLSFSAEREEHALSYLVRLRGMSLPLLTLPIITLKTGILFLEICIVLLRFGILALGIIGRLLDLLNLFGLLWIFLLLSAADIVILPEFSLAMVFRFIDGGGGGISLGVVFLSDYLVAFSAFDVDLCFLQDFLQERGNDFDVFLLEGGH